MMETETHDKKNERSKAQTKFKTLTCCHLNLDCGRHYCYNCDATYDIGLVTASVMVGMNVTDVKLSRKDRVTTITGARSTVKVRSVDAEVYPTLIFMRITCIINNNTEMEDYVGCELAKHPPSLFDKGVIRRTANSALGTH